MSDNIVEVSLIFRGPGSEKNAEAFMVYMDTVDGICQIVDGIKHAGGCVTHIMDDPDQKLVILDGEISDAISDEL